MKKFFVIILTIMIWVIPISSLLINEVSGAYYDHYETINTKQGNYFEKEIDIYSGSKIDNTGNMPSWCNASLVSKNKMKVSGTPDASGEFNFTIRTMYQGNTGMMVTSYAYYHITLKVEQADPTQYTVYFNSNGGSACSQMNTTSSIVLPNTTKDNYVFDGWFTEITDGTFVGKNGDNYSVTSDITLYAHWSPGDCKIILDPAGGIIDGKSSYDLKFGNQLQMPSVEKQGHTFDGWYYNSIKYDIGDMFTVNTTTNITFVAHWVLDTITVTLNGNGVYVSNGTITGDYGSSVSLPELEREKYIFNGWYNGSVAVNDINNYVLSENIELCAHWTPILTLNNISCSVGDYIEIIPVAEGNNIEIEGVSWLTACGNVVSGTAASSGVFEITVTCGALSKTAIITVINHMSLPNVPSNEVIIYAS